MSIKLWYDNVPSGGKGSTLKANSYQRMPKCHTDLRRIVLHSEGVDRKCDGGQHVRNLANYVVSKNIYYHAIYCPDCGRYCQMIPINAAARSMTGASVCNQGNSANRHGKFVVQICIAGYGTSAKGLPKPKNWKGAKVFKAISEEIKAPPSALNFQKTIRNMGKWNNTDKGWSAHSHAPGSTEDHNDIVPNVKQDDFFKQFKKDILKIGK
jgi:hypothetical protein